MPSTKNKKRQQGTAEVIDLGDSDDDVDQHVQHDPNRRKSRRLEAQARPAEDACLLCFAGPSAGRESITLTYGDLRRLRPSKSEVVSPERLLLSDTLIDVRFSLLPKPPCCV